jgi:hypothetical protein
MGIHNTAAFLQTLDLTAAMTKVLIEKYRVTHEHFAGVIGNALKHLFFIISVCFIDGEHWHRAVGRGLAQGIGRLRPGREMGCGSLRATT